MTKEDYIILKAKYPNATDEEILDIAFAAAFDWAVENGFANRTDVLRGIAANEELKRKIKEEKENKDD